MTADISRRRLANFVADNVKNGKLKDSFMEKLAAYIVESGRQREAEMIVRAIEDELQTRGVVVATVTTAHPLTKASRQEIESMINANHIYIREVIDPSVIGGVKIELPDSQIDQTVKTKLMSLRAHKI